jgi:hypothetical protein
MATLSARLALTLSGSLDNILDVGSASYPLAFGQNFNFSDGVGANQAKSVYTDTNTLAASASVDVDLNGVLLDAFNTVINFTKVKAVIVVADPGNTNDVVVGGAASNGAVSFFNASTDKVKVKPGGMFAVVAPDANGYSVTAATADLLRIANGGAGTAVTYTLIVIGV